MCPAWWTCSKSGQLRWVGAPRMAGSVTGCHVCDRCCRQTRGIAQRGCAAPPCTAAPDEAQVHAQAAVDARARQADEDAIGHRRPGGVLGGAVEAGLSGGAAGSERRGRFRATQAAGGRRPAERGCSLRARPPPCCGSRACGGSRACAERVRGPRSRRRRGPAVVECGRGPRALPSGLSADPALLWPWRSALRPAPHLVFGLAAQPPEERVPLEPSASHGCCVR